MFIKKLEVENFKSFFTKQTIIAKKKNIIIGKNGSGKSNLLTALTALFLHIEEKHPQYNNNDDLAVIEVEVDNTDKRFLLPSTFTLRATFTDAPDFTVNGKVISKEELRGLLENAGFTQECFVMQGKVNDIATMSASERFRLISRVAGVEKYEDSKKMAMGLLNEDSEDRIEALIEKIEMKMKITEEYKRKSEEYERLCKMKAEAEYELLNYELLDLNREIDAMSIGKVERVTEENEGIIEFEIKSCKDEVDRLAMKINEAEIFIKKFDESIVNHITARMKENDSEVNPYANKVAVLEKAYTEFVAKLKMEEQKEREKYIELKALKFLNANVKNEDLQSLEKQLDIKRQEIANFSSNGYKENYKQLIGRRKELWIKEKKVKEDLKAEEENEKVCENKILYLGKVSINIYDAIKNSSDKGVVGTVFSLFDIPDDLLDAFEAVTKNSLFWIVVETDDVATKLINTIDGRATFVALNRVSTQPKQKLRSDMLYRLSDKIECDEKYRNLLEMVCKGYYVSTNSNQALELTEKHRVNVVTLEGDIFSKHGSITGGYESSNQILKDLKRHKRRKEDSMARLSEIGKEIGEINEKIKYIELVGEDELRILDNLHAVEKYLQMKIELVKNKKVKVPELSTVEIELGLIQDMIPKMRLELDGIEGQLSRATEKKAKIDEVILKIKTIESAQEELEKIRAREKQLVDMLYMKKANENIEESTRMQRKHLLIDRRTQLMRKLGTQDFRSIFTRRSRDELFECLKDVNKKLRPYSGFSKREIFDDQRLEMKQRLEELRHSKAKILDFIFSLDRKKEETFNLSFSMIAENFSFFFKRFTGKLGSLHLGNETIEIIIDGKNCDMSSLSGGQKTVVALSIIFSVQKNDPSPFYVFDEIDANLDQEHCQKLSDIIKESDSQYFICSFKQNMIDCCDGFFGVISRERESFVDEISRDLAYETVKAPIY